MTIGSVFTGAGGFDLAAEWHGWEVLFQCEINPYARKLIKKRWPGVELLGDITTTDFKPYAGKIDILTAGFPCQPFSLIGEKKGTSDERYLWPDTLRALVESGAPWFVGENVYGLVSWSDGQVFETICSDMESAGYKVAPFIIPASGANAGHERKRIWFIAYSAERRLQRRYRLGTGEYGETASGPVPSLVENRNWTEHAKSYIPRGVHGIPDRVDRTMMLGNAILPQLAYEIFETIDTWEFIWGGE